MIRILGIMPYYKNVLLICTLLLCFQASSYAASVTLQWDANSEPDLVGYKVYYDTDSGDPYNGAGAVEGNSPIIVLLGDLTDSNNPEYTLTGLTDNEVYFFVITAYDNEALESDSSNEVVTLLLLSITSPEDGFYVNATNHTAYTVAGTAAASANVEIKVNGASFPTPETVQAETDGTWIKNNVDFISLGDGAVSLTAVSGGVTSTAVTGTLDRIGPISSAIVPVYGNGALSITWIASDATSGIASTELWYKKGTSGTWANTGEDAQTGTSGTFSYIPAEGDNTYYFATQSTDNAGNVETWSADDGDDSTIFETVAPSSSAEAPTYGNGALSITWTASDATSGVVSTQLWYKKGAAGTWTNTELAAQTGTSGIFTYTPSDGDDTYYFATQSTDNAGNVETKPTDNGDDSTVYDTVAPDLPVITTDGGSGLGNDYSTNNSSITLTGACTTDTYAVYVNGSMDGVSHTPGETTWSYTETLSEGENTFNVTAYDAAGNTSADTLTVTYTPHSTYMKEFGSATGADYPGTLEDTYINLNEENSSTHVYLNTYTWPQDKVANAAIMKWDISAIPSSATIQDAILYLYLGNAGGDDLYDLTAHKIINYNPVISACTGYTYDGTNSWTPNSQCYNNIPLAQVDIAQAEDAKSIDKTYGYKSWNVTNMVQDWVSNSGSNFGMLVNSDTVASSDSNRFFSATESSNPDQRPKLVVTYSVVEDVTPPADVSNFTAIPGDGQVTLSWTNPTDNDFVGTTIRYRTDGTYPTNHTDGTAVDNGNDGKFVNSSGSNDGFDHTGLQNSISYYYSAFTYDKIPNYSEIAHVSTKPTALLAPTATGATPTNDTTPTWTWTSGGGGGNGTFRYKLDNSDLSAGATETTNTAYTPDAQLSEGAHTLYVQEQNDVGNWSNFGIYEIVIDITPTGNPVITTNEGENHTTNDSFITLTGTCTDDTYAVYVNGSTEGVRHTPGETTWRYTGTLSESDNTFDVTAYDAAGNESLADSITIAYNVPPIGGYTADYAIPSDQVSQSISGDGVITIHFKIKDPTNDLCILYTFEYSADSGENWNAPDNDDNSESLSGGWSNNDGSNYNSSTDFDSAEEYSFTFNTQHQDISGLDGEDQSDVQVRFTVNDGAYNSLSPVTSEDFRVDNLKPSAPTDVEIIQ